MLDPRRIAPIAALCGLVGAVSDSRAQPSELVLELPGDATLRNTRPEDRARALFDEDRYNRALICPGSRALVQPPAGAGTIRCAYARVTTVEVGGGRLTAAVTVHGHEHDGMYSRAEEVVLLSSDGRGPPRVAHTLVQWWHSVTDAYTELRARRYAVADLDGTGGRELCVETVEEEGVGLFALMDLEARGRRWHPTRRTRGFAAFEHDPVAGRLVPRSGLDGACPRTGYRRFVETEPHPDGVVWRRDVQGDDRAGVARGRAHARAVARGR